MKNLYHQLIRQTVTLALVSAIIGTTHAAEPLAYYPFDTDLRDYSGNGNHGTLLEANEGPLLSVEGDSRITTTAGEFAVGGGAVHFSRNRDVVSIPVGTLAADANGWAIAFFARNAEVGNNLGGMVIGNNTNTSDHIHVDAGSGFRVRMSNGSNSTFGLTLEDTLWHHYAVVVEDYDSDGSFDDVTLYKDGVYVNTVLNAAGTGFSATTIGDAYTNQFDFDFFGQIDEVYIFDQAITSAKVAELHGSGPDVTAPILIEITDDRLGGPVEPGSVITYTVTFSEDMDENTVTASDFSLVGTAGGSIGSVTEIFPRFFEVEVTPAAVGTLQLQINQNAILSDPAGNDLDTSSAITDDTVITVEIDNTDPTLAPGDIVDEQNGGPVDQGNTVIYTLTFSENMDGATLDAADFGNAGTATYTIGSVTEVAANMFEVEITPTSTGTLQFMVLNGAQLADEASNLLDTAGGILDNTILTVEPGPLGVTRLRVFLLGGQSNALGSNQIDPTKLPTSPVNLQIPREDIPYYHLGNNVIGAGNPYERVVGLQPITRFGPEITMGRGLADGLADGVTTQVAIIKYARGATNLYENWKAGGNATQTGDGAAYQSFQTSVDEGISALTAEYPNAIIEIEGMLWVQGEWDANPSQAGNYQTNLTNFIADIRLTYGAHLPFVISRLSSGQTWLDAASLAVVQAAQDAVAAADPLASVFNTDSFGLFGDELHFDELGLQQIGNAASVQLLDFLNVPTPPQISSLTPAHLSSGHLPTNNLSITFDELIAFGTGNIRLYQNGVGTPIETYDVANPGGNLSLIGDTLTINPTGDLNTFTTYYIEIDATAIEDLDGTAFAGISGNGTWSFTTGEPDTSKPQIQSISPGNGATDIAVGSNLSITFTEDVVFGTGSIVLRENDGSAVESFDVANPPAGLTLNGATLTINPSSDLALGTTYYVEIPNTAIEDLAGNTFDGISGNGTWSFTTIPPDTTAPTVQTLNPADGAINIGAASHLTITFDEAVAFGTGNVLLYQSGGTLVETFNVTNPGSRLSISGAALTINPTNDLNPNTTYYIEIQNTAIEDLAGNNFAGFSGDGTWSFTTADAAAVATVALDFGTPTSNVQTGYTRVTTNGGTNDGTALVGGNISISYSAGQTLHYRDRGQTASFTDLTNLELLRDIVYIDQLGPSDVITFTIRGLTANAEYAVYGYAVDMFGATTNDNKTVTWTTSGGAVNHTTDSGNNALSSARFQMANLSTNGSGEATISAQTSGGIVLWNGFDLVAIGGSDTTPPTLSSTDPTDQASDVSTSANLVATFNETIAAGSGLVTIRNLTDATETTINITDGTQITISGTTLTINPTADLLEGKDYAVRIAATAIEDASGNAFAGIDDDATWRFSTVGAQDTTDPQIETLSPANGSSGIAIGSNLTVTFDEVIAFGTGSITLRQSGGTLVESFDVGTPSARLNLSGTSLAIDPTADLSPATTYYVEIDATAIDDLAGNSFAGISGSGTWGFTTAAPVAPGAMFLFDFQNDLTTDITEGAVAVMDLSSPVNADGVTLTASVGNNLGSSRDRGANTGPNSDITRDFIQWGIATPITITISGLGSDQEYAFRLWSGDLASGQIKTTDHTIAGASGGGTIRHTSVSLVDENATGGSLVVLPNVVSTSTGTLTYTIDYVSGGGTAATLNGFELSAIGSAADPFTTWADSGTLPGSVTFEGDLNADGVADGLAFLLGVANPDDNATGALPIVSEDGNGGLVLTFNCLPVADRGETELKVTYSANLSVWTATAGVVPDANGTDAGGVVSYVVDTESAAPLHRVIATIDASAASGDKLFGRLEGTE